MAPLAFSKLRENFLWRDPRGKVILWALLLLSVLYGIYLFRLWRPRSVDEGFSFLSGSPTRGASLFASFGCKSCHAIYGIGPKTGPDLGTSIPTGSSPLRIVSDMWNHGPEMWKKMREAQFGLPNVSEQDALDLLSYLYIIRCMDAAGDPVRGGKLFYSKRCADCHMQRTQGKEQAPDLRVLNVDTPIVWAQRMWNHGDAMDALMHEAGIPWPTFQDEEMLDLLAYLQKRSSGTRQEAGLLPAVPSRGKVLFEQRGCVACHSTNGEGADRAPDLGSQVKKNPSLIEFAGQMWNHSPQMFSEMQGQGIARPKFEQREMADLIAYLYLIRYLEPVGRVDHGRQVFSAKHCANCHGEDGTGGRQGPSLVRRRPYYASQLAYTIWSHGPEMYRRMRENNIPWPSLSEEELVNLVAFLNST